MTCCDPKHVSHISGQLAFYRFPVLLPVTLARPPQNTRFLLPPGAVNYSSLTPVVMSASSNARLFLYRQLSGPASLSPIPAADYYEELRVSASTMLAQRVGDTLLNSTMKTHSISKKGTHTHDALVVAAWRSHTCAASR